MHKNIRWAALLILVLQIQVNAQSLPDLLKQLGQSTEAKQKTVLLNKITRLQLDARQPDKAIVYAQQALTLANQNDYTSEKAQSLMYLGKAHKAKQHLSQSLDYYLQAAANFELLQNKALLAATYHHTGMLYQEWKAQEKAIDYFKKSYQLVPSPALLMAQGKSYFLMKNYRQASNSYQQALNNYQKQKDIENSNKALIALVKTHTLANEYEKAIKDNERLLALNQGNNQVALQVTAYNNLGFLHQKLNRPNKALAAFNQALYLYNQLPEMANKKTDILINVGAIYTRQRQYARAIGYYQQGLHISEKQENTVKTAELHNYIAATHYVSRNNESALVQVRAAIDLVKNYPKNIQAQQVRQNSYKILAKVYQQNNNIKNYQKYYSLHIKIKDSLNKARNIEEQRILKEQLVIEKKESEFKMLLADKEKQALSLKQLKLESEKKERDLRLKAKELELLKKNQELQSTALRNQQLEKGKVEQLLALAKQKARTEEQKALTEKQKRETERQKLLAAKQKVENLQKAKALEAAQKEKALQQEQLKQEKVLRQYGTGLLISVGLLFIFVLFSFIASQKARRKLKKQNAEIQKQKEEITEQNQALQMKTEEIAAQNEELQQNQEEIMAQRDFIEVKNKDMALVNTRLRQSEKVLRKAFDKLQKSEQQVTKQNKELQLINHRINNSISVAQTIQNAILPRPQKMQQILNNHFTIYHPKDVVSGDFYWLEEVDNKVFLIAADCTGHGVPGALMSMVGNVLIDKVILIKKIVEPDQILEELHKEIRISLNQEESGDDNGMDIVVVCLDKTDKDKVKVTFCGAKNPMYYVEKGSSELHVLKGTRRSIGGRQPDFIPFESQEIVLNKGSLIYMGSDGFVDQNNEKRASFGTKRLRKLLENCATIDIHQQKKLMEQTLQKHKENTTQRDDILFIGLEV